MRKCLVALQDGHTYLRQTTTLKDRAELAQQSVFCEVALHGADVRGVEIVYGMMMSSLF